jgi:hypothetical protein
VSGTTVAVWSPYSSGHHPSYAHRVCKSAFHNFPKVILFAPYSSSLQSGANLAESELDDLSAPTYLSLPTPDFGPYQANSIIGQFLQFISIFFNIFKCKPSALLVLYSDSLLLFLPLISLVCLCLGCRPAFVFFRLRFHLPNFRPYQRAISFYQLLAIRLSSYLSARSYTTDIFSFEWLNSRNPSCLRFLPEQCITPTNSESSPTFSELVCSHSGSFNLLVFGAIDSRKCLDLLIFYLKTFSPHIKLTCAGKISPQANSILSGLTPHNLTIFDYYCPNSLLKDLLDSSDAVWCAQLGHEFASASICSAIAYGKIAIYTDGHYIQGVASGYNKSITAHDFFSLPASDQFALSRISPSFYWKYKLPLFCNSWSPEWL